MTFTKAHAYGNDFLYVESDDHAASSWPETARAVCERHTGIGGDGLIVYRRTPDGASMRLFNADGSSAEVSGNGVRGLAALLVWQERAPASPGSGIAIDTDAGRKQLELLETEGTRSTFRAAMGSPTDIRDVQLDVGAETVAAVAMRMGNPQCVVLEAALDDVRYRSLGSLIERHPAFPDRTNVEFAQIEGPGTVRILIWERGVGPTRASGTGACAAAVAAMLHGRTERRLDVISPGGSQVVEWREPEVYLTGWAEVVWEGRWIG